MRFLAGGDTALVVEFGEEVDRQVNGLVLALADRVERAQLPGVIELVPTFRSLMVHYDPLVIPGADLRDRLARLMDGLAAAEIPGRDWVLPACYEGDLAPDLEDVARRTGLDAAEVIALHSRTVYRVYCLGFLPGYPYMGDTPEVLNLPRRETPRLRVPMGSVCIAVGMTGIYSLESPGGWHLIARTPVRLFDTRRRDAILLRPGDRVRFDPVSRRDWELMEAEAAEGRLKIAPEGPAGAAA
ncbi:MAG TPA: 5-oxoprolinase subunit PxpB [Hyphomicrobiaceae bacterium]|nr:5-oxoprolinase subunit PxpB [Hyphomicrobiaceae bacterium]